MILESIGYGGLFDYFFFNKKWMVLFRFIQWIYNYYFFFDKMLVKWLRFLIGFIFVNFDIFKLVFLYKLMIFDKVYVLQNNECLEYLGDVVLGIIVVEYFFKKYFNSNEGFLIKMWLKIVKWKFLNKIGDKMGLDMFLVEYNNICLSCLMFGNVVEVLVGVVYLEQGYFCIKCFVIRKVLCNYVDVYELESFDDNYKSQLLEWC